MLLERIYDEDLSQASYFIGCQSQSVALVVDPPPEPVLVVPPVVPFEEQAAPRAHRAAARPSRKSVFMGRCLKEWWGSPCSEAERASC